MALLTRTSHASQLLHTAIMGAKKTANDIDVQALQKLLAGTNAQVFGPSDEGYSATIERWSRAAEKPAGVTVLPTSAEEVYINRTYRAFLD